MDDTILVKLNRKVFNKILASGIDINKFVLVPASENKENTKLKKKNKVITWDDLNEETKEAINSCEKNNKKRKSFNSFKELLKDCGIEC